MYVSVPSGATEGPEANSPGLLFEVSKLTLCDESEAGPGVMADAQPTDCAPASSRVLRSPPAMKLGGWLGAGGGGGEGSGGAAAEAAEEAAAEAAEVAE